MGTQTTAANKSTNVRSISWNTLRKQSVRSLSALSPALAALWAERMFLTPRRHARPEREQAWAASAQRGAVRYRGQELPTYSWGAGQKAVLLVHGWEGRGTQLSDFVPPLLAAGYRVIAVDLPGHGEASPSLSSVADFAQALQVVITGLGPFHGVVAHSMGAAAVTLARSLTPFEARLVLIGAPRGPLGFFDGFIRYLGLGPDVGSRVARRIERRYGLPFAALDVDQFGSRVPLPALVVHDRGDKEVPFEHASAIVSALPTATLVATEGLGHRRILRDERVIAAALQFLGVRADELVLPSAA